MHTSANEIDETIHGQRSMDQLLDCNWNGKMKGLDHLESFSMDEWTKAETVGMKSSIYRCFNRQSFPTLYLGQGFQLYGAIKPKIGKRDGKGPHNVTKSHNLLCYWNPILWIFCSISSYFQSIEKGNLPRRHCRYGSSPHKVHITICTLASGIKKNRMFDNVIVCIEISLENMMCPLI